MKKLEGKLLVGVILLPIVFVWFLNKDYEKSTRIKAWVWTVFTLLGAFAR